jgi:hypothetical protein
MIGSLGLPELIIILAVASIWPAVFFAIGYYFGRRSALRNAGVSPAGPAAPALSGAEGSSPPHV